MISKNYLLCVVILSNLLAAEAIAKDTPREKPREVEKCYGVARAGKNDCASKDGRNSCAGHAKKDSDPNDWIYVPKGLCEKIAGGAKE